MTEILSRDTFKAGLVSEGTITVPDPVADTDAVNKAWALANPGPAGPPGGAYLSAQWNFNQTTTSGPASGTMRMNSTTYAATTTLWIHETDRDGLDRTAGLNTLNTDCQIIMQSAQGRAVWDVTSVADSGTYRTVGVTMLEGTGTRPSASSTTTVYIVPPPPPAIPAGGTTGQVLAKNSNTDYDTEWADSVVVPSVVTGGTWTWRDAAPPGDPTADSGSAWYVGPGAQIALTYLDAHGVDHSTALAAVDSGTVFYSEYGGSVEDDGFYDLYTVQSVAYLDNILGDHVGVVITFYPNSMSGTSGEPVRVSWQLPARYSPNSLVYGGHYATTGDLGPFPDRLYWGVVGGNPAINPSAITHLVFNSVSLTGHSTPLDMVRPGDLIRIASTSDTYLVAVATGAKSYVDQCFVVPVIVHSVANIANWYAMQISVQSPAPPGGTTGQVLAKNSNTDYDTEWTTIPTITVGTTAPSSPAVNDIWVDTN